jgi:hypothetical protein
MKTLYKVKQWRFPSLTEVFDPLYACSAQSLKLGLFGLRQLEIAPCGDAPLRKEGYPKDAPDVPSTTTASPDERLFSE